MPDVQISRGDANQIDRLRPVFLMLHDHHRGFSAVALTEPNERAWTERASTYAEYFANGRALLHLATHQEQCVGYALTVVHDSNDDTFPLAPRYAELYTLAVLPNWRGSGVGSRLMDAVDSALQDAAIANLTVAIAERTPSAADHDVRTRPRRCLTHPGSADHLIPAWDVAQTGGYFACDQRLAASDLTVPVSSPTAESELRALVDDATEHCPSAKRSAATSRCRR